MRALGHQGWTAIGNRKHPDFKMCTAAWSFSETGAANAILTWRNAVSKRYLLREDNNTTTPSPMKWGMGISTGATFNTAALRTIDTFPAFVGGFSWMCQVKTHVVGGFPLEIFEISNVIFMLEQANFAPAVYDTAGNVKATSGVALNAEQEYSLGIRYMGGTNNFSFFVNGARTDIAGAAITPASTILQTGSGTFRNSWGGSIRDLRIYNTPMPDSTFERYTSNPNGFYVAPKVNLFRTIAAAAGFRSNFFPFLHPSLTS